MGIGVSVFLLAVGAILAFAVRDAIDGVALGTVGYILMAAGAVGIVIAMIMNNQRANTSHTTRVDERRIVE